MEIIYAIAAVVAILGFVINLIGWARVREWLPWIEKGPYVIALRYKQCPENDPVIGKTFQAAKNAGRNPQWFPVDVEQTKIREGFEPLRTQDGERAVLKSKTLAHCDALVMMALRASVKE
jgi:hypothetical protein